MDYYSTKLRKQVFWRTRAPLNYGKLPRSIKLPFSETNPKRRPSSNLQQFINDLLNRSNFSRNVHINSITFGVLLPFPVVPDETEGSNFITCVSSDTFWSIAKLFQRLFQPFVWASAGGTLLVLAAILLLLTTTLCKWSGLKLFLIILLNLPYWKLSQNIGGFTGVDQIWWRLFLYPGHGWSQIMCIILTNSYKGLIPTDNFLLLIFQPFGLQAIGLELLPRNPRFHVLLTCTSNLRFFLLGLL